MSVIIRASGNIGPFKIIVPWPPENPDRLRCDGTDYPFSVIGPHTISSDDSLAPVPPAKPVEVPKLAVKLALVEAGKEPLPDTYINSLVGLVKKKARRKWDERDTLRRDAPMSLAAIAAGLLTSAEADAIMVRADEIRRAGYPD